MSRAIILGGTGTLGQELVRQLTSKGLDVIVVSRDEQKQVAQARAYPNVTYRLADITDKSTIEPIIRKADVVYHVAALKHVDFLESNTIACMRVNVLGTKNVIECCQSRGAKLVFSSTDKAVDPINAYGYSKALAEKMVAGECENYQIFRWGNVLGSRGSVIPHFVDAIKTGNPVSITDLRMTRFWLTIEDAVGFMIEKSMQTTVRGEFIYPKMKAALVTRICDSIARVLGVKQYSQSCIGIRPGEKLHESLVSVHKPDHINSKDCTQYTNAELDGLLKPIVGGL